MALRLAERRKEIEQATLTRVLAVSESSEFVDPEYADGLREAVRSALDYGLAAVELGEERSASVPPVLLAQARLAARSGVSLDTVLRRYFAGYTLLGDVLVQEAERGALKGPTLQRVMREQAALFDRLLTAITAEYTGEAASRQSSTGQRRTERVRRLLAGELIETGDLAYDFDAFHLGLLAVGHGAADAIRHLARRLDRRSLVVRSDQATTWAWLGGRSAVGVDDVLEVAGAHWPAEVMLAIGESAPGISGWRISHRQARAALPIALRGSQRIVRYADVALLASALRDDLLASSLEEVYLDPLAGDPDDGAVLRRTLHDYFTAGRNVSSTAAALGVSRQTVNSRLRAIEEKLGRTLDTCAAELETALRLRLLSSRQIR